MLTCGAARTYYCQKWRAKGELRTIKGMGGYVEKNTQAFRIQPTNFPPFTIYIAAMISVINIILCPFRTGTPFMGFLSVASHSPAVRINASDPIRPFRSHAECQHGHHTQQEVNSGIVGLIGQTPACELASPSISDTPDRWRRSAAGHSSEKHGGRRRGTKISNRSRLCFEKQSRMCRSSPPAHLRSSHTALANGPCPEQLSLFSAETSLRSNRCNSARCGH